MRSKPVRKLVRDQIPALIQQTGHQPQLRRLTQKEFLTALLDKLSEELAELRQAKTPTEVKNELADILEVVETLARYHKIPLEKLYQHKASKKQKHGGFKKRIFLESVTKKDD